MTMKRMRTALAAVLAVVAVASPGRAGSEAGPEAGSEAMVATLAGRWSGWGSIVMAQGATEKVRCVVSYDVAGAALRQSLRCASAGYRVDADADLRLDGERISGRWSERNYSAEGSVTGRASAAGLNVTVEGDHFSAQMALITSRCRQAITIAPRGIDVARVSIELTRC